MNDQEKKSSVVGNITLELKEIEKNGNEIEVRNITVASGPFLTIFCC